MTLSNKLGSNGVSFGHSVCIALEEVERMQMINDNIPGEEPEDYDVLRLLRKIKQDLIAVQQLANRQ